VHRATLYVGIAAPLVEAARAWQVELDHDGDPAHLEALKHSFPGGPIVPTP